jgi:hypothetical protein
MCDSEIEPRPMNDNTMLTRIDRVVENSKPETGEWIVLHIVAISSEFAAAKIFLSKLASQTALAGRFIKK